MKEVAQLRILGERFEEQGDYESAEAVLRKALHLEEGRLGSDHPSLASDLYNLGVLCYALDKYADAEFFLTRAWMIEKRHLGKLHPETVSTLNLLSELYFDEGYHSEEARTVFFAPPQASENGQPLYH